VASPTIPELSVRIFGLSDGTQEIAVALGEVVGKPTLGGLVRHLESKLGYKADRVKADALEELDDTSPVDQLMESLFGCAPLQGGGIRLWAPKSGKVQDPDTPLDAILAYQMKHKDCVPVHIAAYTVDGTQANLYSSL